MKNQALLSSKDKSKKLKCRLLQFLFGALRLKSSRHHYNIYLVEWSINSSTICQEYPNLLEHSEEGRNFKTTIISVSLMP